MLYVVATPLGNLEDLTLRARRILGEVEVIYAEDTRHSRRLLDHIGVRTQLRAYHDHTTDAERARIVEALRGGQRAALITDAGTPCISDPGFKLVQQLRAAEVPVVPVPGPSAVAAFLSAAGLPTDMFRFVGFPPRKAQARAQAVALWMAQPETTVCYESPQRLTDLLADVLAVDPARHVVLGRELTKMHEEFVDGTATDVHAQLAARDRVLGECVLGIAGAPPKPVEDETLAAWVTALAPTRAGTKELAAILAQQLGVATEEAYRLLLQARAS